MPYGSKRVKHTYLGVVAHDVVEARQEAVAGGDLGVHGAVDVVEEVERLADQLVALAQQALLDLRLPAREHVVRVRRLPPTSTNQKLFNRQSRAVFVAVMTTS